MSRLFGTDGVRGIANQDLTVELALRLGRAAAFKLAHRSQTGREPGHGDRPRVILARDTRTSGDMLEAALVAGMTSTGADVLLAGVMPTPAVAYLATALEVDAGVMLSASHNPFDYNGIKFFSHQGYKLPDALEDEIEQLTLSDQDIPRPTAGDVGRAEISTDAVRHYEEHLLSVIAHRLDGLRIVVDCAQGAAHRIAPETLRALGAQVVALYDQPDGVNINAGCGALHPEILAQAVREQQADVGLVFDGDADRLMMADERGQVVDGDQVMAITARHLKSQGRLPGDLVVGTVMNNLGLELALQETGIALRRTRVGDRYVLEEMLATGARLGGEQSGHIIFLDHATTGDGLITALVMLDIMVGEGRPLSELASIVTRCPQVLINVAVRERVAWDQDPEIAAAIAAVEQELDGHGRVVVRASGTEPLIRVMVEGTDGDRVAACAESIAGAIRQRFA
jgi:phosphoglucosamine mutase